MKIDAIGAMAALVVLICVSLGKGQALSDFQPEEDPRRHRLQVWRDWGHLSETELWRAYGKTQDAWLREHVPSLPPLRVEEGGTRLTSGYGYRVHPIHGAWKFHNGIDLSGRPGQAVYATAQGIVLKSGFDPWLGNFIVITHAGQFETLYGHLSRILVKPGQLVRREEAIGQVGRTGSSAGYHLHYIVKRFGRTVDSDAYLFLRFGLYSLSRMP